MCEFKSGIIFKNRVEMCENGNESHSDCLEKLNIEDNENNAMRVFVRAELIPDEKDGLVNYEQPVDEWKFNVDQDILPDWFSIDQ